MTVLSSARMQRLMRYLGLLLAAVAVQACSVAPPPDPKVPGPACASSSSKRVSAVIVTDRSSLRNWVKRGFPMSQAPGDADGGSATPISPDGYFLTADHVLARMDGRNVFVLHGRGGRWFPIKARVVWRSRARIWRLLHIPPAPRIIIASPIPGWLATGTPVIHGGIATGFKSDPGKLGTSHPTRGPSPAPANSRSTSRCNPGDSGGPVVDAYGNLVGINSAVEFLVPMETAFFVDSEANRPNTRMIESLIGGPRPKQKGDGRVDEPMEGSKRRSRGGRRTGPSQPHGLGASCSEF
jgi:hypothetical protein